MPNQNTTTTQNPESLVGQYVRVEGYKGIAFFVDEVDTEPDEDTEWSGYENPTGLVRAHMVGDDRTFKIEPEDIEILDEDEFCDGCGQIGCGWC